MCAPRSPARPRRAVPSSPASVAARGPGRRCAGWLPTRCRAGSASGWSSSTCATTWSSSRSTGCGSGVPRVRRRWACCVTPASLDPGLVEMAVQSVKFYQVGSRAVGNRLLDEALRTEQASPARRNALNSGHRACQGCGEALGARYVLDAAVRATGGKLLAVNAPGCLEVFSTPYPESSWQLPWLHSLFANAPSVASGVAAALKAQGRDDVRVLAQGGDGGTVDIGLACLSGMFERNDDVLYVCYDNEAYMHTGV